MVSNFLSDATETPISSTYRPTHVTRIIEFEVNTLNVDNRVVKAEVELWDTSGNHSFEASWPALSRDAHGVVFVFDPHEEEQVSVCFHFFDA